MLTLLDWGDIFEKSKKCMQVIGTSRRSIFHAPGSSQMPYMAKINKICNFNHKNYPSVTLTRSLFATWVEPPGVIFLVSYFRLQIPSLISHFSCFTFHISYFDFPVPNFRFHISYCKFNIAGFRLYIPGCIFQLSDFSFHDSDFKFPISGFIFQIP